jgi:hypothetical protein
MKHPAWQVPLVPEQYSPAPQDVPLARVDHAVVLAAGWHVWHALLGFTPPGG